MKKLTTLFGAFLIASVVLTSCGGGEPTACDCADLSLEAIGEAMEVMDDPTKAEEITKKWEKKLKPCTDLSETNADFQAEIEECLKTKMSDMF